MSKPRVFIDGQAGTIGLRIRDLLSGRDDIEILEIAPERRKDGAARAELLNAANVSILCLPDDAAREAVALLDNPEARVIDGSTAHRTAPGWVYGLPELAAEQRDRIREARLVSNPGCYPTCVLLLLRPLLDAALVARSAPITVHALSGYTGGGNALIARWEDAASGLSSLPFEAPYAFDRRHKHVAEMVAHAQLEADPQFVPAVGPFRCGMRVQIPLHAAILAPAVSAERVFQTLSERYRDEAFVEVSLGEPGTTDERSFDPRLCNGTNRVQLHVLPNPSGHVLLVAIIDNLGKGASGAAVQSLNLMLGLGEQAGLA